MFALALIIVPGGVFAVVAFSGARDAVEREVGIQLQQIAEQGADALGAALERARSNAGSWATQDLMRDLVIGDIDKRVSRFLATTRASNRAYLEVVCVDTHGRIIAASSGDWLGREAGDWQVVEALAGESEALTGPTVVAGLDVPVLQIGVAIRNPDSPADRIGALILIYDWTAIAVLLDNIRLKLTHLGKRVEGYVVDGDGRLIGTASSGRQGRLYSSTSTMQWKGLAEANHWKRWRLTGDGEENVLVGGARVAQPDLGWSVLFVEPTSDALAPVARVRRRWTIMLAGILLVGLAAAALLARQIMRPLEEVTRATSRVASHLDLSSPLVPVRSRNEIGELAESFNKMIAELRRREDEALTAAKFAFAGELAAMVAHEVRTPLSSMRSAAQMLADPESGSRDNTELVAIIVAEVDRIGRVVSGLLELTRPLVQRLEPTPLRDVLARAADFVAAQAERQQVRIERDFEARALASCDRDQIFQVVLNLLVNALQVLPGGGRIRLRTVADASGMVGCEVEDDGPGIPTEMREEIFQPFVTGREGGTGLGLAFVDRVVKAHGGKLSVHSEPGRGAVLRVWLPAAQDGV